ncbi:uncharacterized protein VTP21DRAFT_508 [Calcarisporiella thermophila]|uniref:uncharacterized protein n=1 Tax=Calcarisporiella thermophila TaxID=911321 RepID=UPI003743B18C
MPAAGSLLNLEQQLTFYKLQRKSRVNLALQLVCVPLVLWGVLVIASEFGLTISPKTAEWLWPLSPNLAFVAAFIYIAYYLLLEPVASLLFAPVILYLAYNATNFRFIEPNYRTIALSAQISGLVLQLFGYWLAGRREFILKDNLQQFIFLAPLFIWLEVLFSLGYRPALNERIKNRVDLAIKKHYKEEAEKSRENALKSTD